MLIMGISGNVTELLHRKVFQGVRDIWERRGFSTFTSMTLERQESRRVPHLTFHAIESQSKIKEGSPAKNHF